ncbi:TolC family protein [Cyclobacterium qasimii]|uniref:Outer membrane protein, RND efflux system n=2 Tax=Cyclobacterium qasimii TaxID=1350429 RepID=S7WWF6_9BACT|nr:TolC family protein [Cyclobacterium qasimii]EPR68343.1 Outer membrane protein, RND efflux system precursor [Cyclobacterium qasimii M12-11B]GEO23598.1 transporter [Cyclobacterium qasimii]
MKPYKGAFAILLILLATVMPSVTKGQELDPILKELINKGVSKSHTVNGKYMDAEQAKIDQQLAKSVFLPKITLNGSYTHLNDDITFDDNTKTLLTETQKLVIKDAVGLPFNSTFPNTIPLQEIPVLQNQNILRSSVDVDWVLFSGLEASNALQASKHKEASLNYVGMAEEDKTALQIIEAYDKLALVKASKKVLTTSENYLNEQATYVSKAIENGLATPISRNKIELARQQLEAKKLEFEHNNILLIEVLHQLTGESRTDLRILHPQLHSFTVDANSSGEKRNEIKALEEAEQATQYKAKMLKSNFIPKVALKGHYEFIEENLSLLDPKWYVGVGLKWNVFDGNQSRLKRRKVQLETAKYREQIEEANEMIALGISKAEISYESALLNSKIVQKEIDLANENYEMVNTQYKNNLASINDVMDALNDVEKANFKLQESYFKERRAVADLLHAKGILNY